MNKPPHKPMPIDSESLQLIEETLVASFIGTDNRTRDQLSLMVFGHHFTADHILGKVWNELVLMHEAGEPIEPGAIRERLTSAGLWIDFGRAGRLARMFESISVNPIFYAGKLREAYQRHQARLTLELALRDIDDATRKPSDVLVDVSASLNSLAGQSDLQFKTASDFASEIVSNLDKPRRGLVFSGLSKFDEHVGGFGAGELVVIAARTSLGKSALAAQIGEWNATKGKTVLYVTLEMSGQDLVSRILTRESRVSQKRIAGGGLSEPDKQEVRTAAGVLEGLRFYPQYMPGAKLPEIVRTAKGFRSQHGVDLVVIDYLQIIERADSRVTLREHLGDCTRTMKRLAGELGVPVILLSQFNRQSEKQTEPTLANLSESSSIEADADTVVAIHRKDPQDEEGQLLVLKNRSGQCIDLEGLIWNKADLRFEFKSNRFTEFD